MLFVTAAFFLYKKLIVLLMILFFAGITEYITSKNEVAPSFGHVFFLAMMVAKINNVWSAAIILLFAGVLPNLLLGSMDVLKISSYALQLISIVIFSLFSGESFIIPGLLLAVLCYGLTFLIARATGSSMPELIMETLIPLALNFIYFLSFASPFMYVVKNLIQG